MSDRIGNSRNLSTTAINRYRQGTSDAPQRGDITRPPLKRQRCDSSASLTASMATASRPEGTNSEIEEFVPSTPHTISTRSGRRGRPQCEFCRRSKKGLVCEIDPNSPHGACTVCVQKGREHECHGPVLPDTRKEQSQWKDIAEEWKNKFNELSNTQQSLSFTVAQLNLKLSQTQEQSRLQAENIKNLLLPLFPYLAEEIMQKCSFSTEELPQIPLEYPASMPLIDNRPSNSPHTALYDQPEFNISPASSWQSTQPSSSTSTSFSQVLPVPSIFVSDHSDHQLPTPCPTMRAIWDILCQCCFDRTSANVLTVFIDDYFRSSKVLISNFGAKLLPYINLPDKDAATERYSPILEWHEGDNDVLAFVRIPPTELEPCSYLMHFTRQCPVTGVRESYLKWRVLHLEYMNGLFRQAQMLGGILSWSTNDLINFCMESRDEVISSKDVYDLISRLVSLERQAHGVEETLANVLPILRSRIIYDTMGKQHVFYTAKIKLSEEH